MLKAIKADPPETAESTQMELFPVGTMVEKYTGDYQISGEVRAVFTTTMGKMRYVVEHTPGFLHIYSPAQLRRLPTTTSET